MGCNCKKKRDLLTPDATNLEHAYPARSQETDLVVLQSDPSCTERYQGTFRRATVFVVGYGTEHETLYKRGERTAAIKHAKGQRLSIATVQAGQLCQASMLQLLGS